MFKPHEVDHLEEAQDIQGTKDTPWTIAILSQGS